MEEQLRAVTLVADNSPEACPRHRLQQPGVLEELGVRMQRRLGKARAWNTELCQEVRAIDGRGDGSSTYEYC